jgi:hypothetical protein
VCAYGIGSGYRCGNLVELNLSVITQDGDFDGVNKVNLGAKGFDYDEDLGGPVYLESKIRDRTTAQALGYITYFDNSDPNQRFVYYTPLEKAFGSVFDGSFCS